MSDVNNVPQTEEQLNTQQTEAEQVDQQTNQDSEQSNQVVVKPRANFFVRCLKRFGRMIVAALSFTVTVALLLVLLLFTPAGNKLLWSQVTHWVDGVDGKLVSGSLQKGWVFEDLNIALPGLLELQAKRIALEWCPADLMNKQLPIERLALEGVRVAITEQQPSTESTPSSNTPLDIPLDVMVQQLSLNDIAVSYGDIKVQLDDFDASASLISNAVTIPKFAIDGLHVNMPTSKPETVAVANPVKPSSNGLPFELPKIELPTVELPLPIDLQQFSLKNFTFKQGEMKQALTELGIAFQWRKTKLQNLQLGLQYQQFKAQLAGDVDLSNNYPLNLVVKLQTNHLLKDTEHAVIPLNVVLNANGSLDALKVNIANSGVLPVKLKAALTPLDLMQPMRLNVAWQPIQWPLYTKTPDVKVSAGSLDWSGKLTDYKTRLSAEVIAKGQPALAVLLQGKGTLSHFDIIKLAVTPNHTKPVLFLAGKVDWRSGVTWRGALELNKFQPELFAPNVSGEISGRLETDVSIQPSHWQFKLSSLAINGTLRNMPLQLSGRVDAWCNPKARFIKQALNANIDRLSLKVGDNYLNVHGSVAKQLDLIADLKVPKLDFFHPDIDGDLSGHVEVAGTIDQPFIDVDINSSEIKLADDLTINKITVQGHGQQKQAIDGWLKLRVEKVITPQAVIDGIALAVNGNATPEKQIADVKAKITTGALSTVFEGQTTKLVTGVDVASTTAMRPERLRSQLAMRSKELGQADINVAVDELSTAQKLSGNIAFSQFKLDFLKALVPALDKLEGMLFVNARMGGTLKKPLLFGDIDLKNAAVAALNEQLSITDWHTKLHVNGEQGTVSGGFQLGGGELKIGGDLSWHSLPVKGAVTIKGQDLAVGLDNGISLAVSPDLKVAIGKKIVLNGRVVVPRASIKINSLPKSAVMPSSDVVVIVKKQPSILKQESKPLFVEVNVVLGDDVKVDAYGFKSGLEGQIRINMEPAKAMSAQGSIDLVNGRYHQFGQDLLIKKGLIIFSGPLSSPNLSVNAIRNPNNIVNNVTVGINVTGSPSNPELSIYSVPVMSQQEQWSYFLRGQPLDGDSSGLQAMLLSYGVNAVGGMVSGMGNAIGISDLTLGTQGDGADTQVTIGGNINKRLRVEYGAGVFSSIAELTVRYQLMPKLYLQAVSGLEQTVELFYQFNLRGREVK